MRSIVLTGSRGGCGRTALALNLADELARGGLRVLLIDADPKGGLGLSIGPQVAGADGLVDLDGGRGWRRVVIQSNNPGLRILPRGQLALADAAARIDAVIAADTLAQVLAGAADEHDVALIDTAAAPDRLALAALAAATDVVAVVPAEPLGLRGLPGLLRLVAALREGGARVRLLGLVMSMLDMKDPRSIEVAEELWEIAPEEALFAAFVPREPAFVTACAEGVPLRLLRRPPPLASAGIERLAVELRVRLGLAREEVRDAPRALVD